MATIAQKDTQEESSRVTNMPNMRRTRRDRQTIPSMQGLPTYRIWPDEAHTQNYRCTGNLTTPEDIYFPRNTTVSDRQWSDRNWRYTSDISTTDTFTANTRTESVIVSKMFNKMGGMAGALWNIRRSKKNRKRKVGAEGNVQKMETPAWKVGTPREISRRIDNTRIGDCTHPNNQRERDERHNDLPRHYQFLFNKNVGDRL